MARNCDVIVFGSTGYTGRLVAEYLLKTYGANGPVKWAMAGRSHVKLEEVRAEIGAPASVPLVVADSSNAASLAAMAEQQIVAMDGLRVDRGHHERANP